MKKLILLAAFAALCAAGEAPSPARAQLTHYLAALNTGDRGAFDAYLADNLAPSLDRAVALSARDTMFKDHGGFDLVSATESSPNALHGKLRGRRTHDLLTVTFEVEPQAPHRLSNYSVLWDKPTK
ncbi:MAG TPA: hypothetical protein VMF52_01645 [Steroidobacteraceae bacterium]|nr:hypothetical protein [Steroidobacteraceae bacterium]